jgi:hypothetical protein
MKININNIMEKLHALNLSIKNILSFINRSTFLVVCTYYVMNTKGYAVSIGPLVKNVFFQNFLSSFFNAIIAEFEHFGVMIMVLPMMLVATSFLECSAVIRVSATLIAAGGNIFSIFHGLHRGIFLDESFRIGGLFTIYHEFKFENKVIAFKQTFQAFVDQSLFSFNGSNAFPLFVKDYLDKHWISILEPIKTTPMKDIQTYAKKTLLFLETKYKETLTPPSSVPPVPSASTGVISSIIFYGSIALIVLGVGYFIYKWFTDDTHAKLTTDIAKENLASSQNLTNVIDNTQLSLQNLQTITTATSNVIVDTFPKIRDEFTVLHHKFNVLAERLGVDESQTKNISLQIQQLITSAQPHPQDLTTLFDQIALCTKNIDLQNNLNLDLANEIESLQTFNSKLQQRIQSLETRPIIDNLQQRIQSLETRPILDPNNNNIVNNNQLDALAHNLQRDFHFRIDLIEKNFDNKFNTAQQIFESRQTSIATIHESTSESAKAAFKREQENLANSILELQHTKTELKSELSKIASQFQNKKDATLQEVQQHFASKFTQLQKMEIDLNSRFNAKLARIYDASEIDCKVDQLESSILYYNKDLKKKIETLDETINQKLNTMEATLNSHTSDIKFASASAIANSDLIQSNQREIQNVKDHHYDLTHVTLEDPQRISLIPSTIQVSAIQAQVTKLESENRDLRSSLSAAWKLIKTLHKDMQILKNINENPVD